MDASEHPNIVCLQTYTHNNLTPIRVTEATERAKHNLNAFLYNFNFSLIEYFALNAFCLYFFLLIVDLNILLAEIFEYDTEIIKSLAIFGVKIIKNPF